MNFKLSINNSCQRMLAFFVTATVAAVFMMVSMVHAATWWVDGDVATSGDGTYDTPFKTINEGISAASAGDKVAVGWGTYNEQLVIDKQLTLDGTSPSRVHVVPLDVPTDGVYDVEIKASGTIIKDIRFVFNGTDGTRSGNGIIVGELNGPPVTDVQILDNYIYTGDGKTGIQTGKNADVSGLIISGVASIYPGNWIRGDQDSICEGVYIHPYNGAGNVTIQENTFSDFSYCGLSIEASNVHVLDNYINSDPLNGVYGIRFVDLAGGENYSNVVVSGNRIRNVQNGISLGTGCGANLTITNNYFEDNTQYGMVNETDTVVIAENNWWGDATGPYHPSTNPDGLGNPVSDYIDYEPWLANHPPELDPIGDTVVTSGEYIEIIITATDPDNDNLNFVFSGRPAGAKLTQMTGTPENPAPPNIVLQWTPYHFQARNRPYECSVQVTDDGTPSLSDSENFSITVVQAPIDGPLIEKMKRRHDLDGPPGMTILGVNLGRGDPGDYIRIGKSVVSPGDAGISRWTPKRINFALPTRMFTKNGCAWFKGRESRRVSVWVNVGGVDSNIRRLRLIKPTGCQ